MFKNVTIKARLIFIIVLLSVVSTLIGAVGMRNLNTTNEALETVYNDRLVATGQLSEVLSLIQQSQGALSKSVSGNPEQFPAMIEEVEKRIEAITGIWNSYMATYLTPEEKLLAKTFADNRKKFVEEGLRPVLAAMRGNDIATAVSLVHGPLTQTYVPVQDSMKALVKLQLDVGKMEYEQAIVRYRSAQILAISLNVIGVLIGVVVGWILIRGITGAIKEALNFASNVAEGNLAQRMQISSNDEMGKLLASLQKMNDGLITIVSQVRSGTDTIATASGQIAAGSQDLSSRTEEQASSLEETASSMEELTSTVKQNADNARQANALAVTASGVAERGGEVIGQVVQTMGGINDSAKKIGDIIGVIDGIAFQTNILALNAAVEAARAGEQGRGFAVVASEVRNLAQRSAAAAKEIKILIDNSVERVETGSKLVNDAGATMRDIVDSVRRVTDIIGEITAASDEQTAGIEQINQAVSQMDEVTQQNAALVEETAAASEAMQDQAAKLAKVVSVFKL
ncbi:methyl-accepting chemotaxis protein [Noviherbaspirillum saxi]|uniref:HAMP domain-containing protein n=1 Tax=Noviherbaspirillum saxi TaxID=2320863 RepID=A0A3A3FSD2_9BURK|nr:methyl-accepting chemotaxis protein [Noviherbaspirillum saxi]RJF98174.1 HAMP domain-containing protein [Noviherbaspirillum saxi]